MTAEIATVLFIIVIMSISFFTEILPLAFTAFMVPVLLQVTGILTAAQAWSGFSNTTVITFISMFIISGVFAKTSVTYRVKMYVKKHSNNSPTRVTIMILIACSILSILTSASSTLAALTPLVMEICKDNNLDEKRVFKSIADVTTWAAVQMLPLGSSLSYFILFNQYLEASGTSLRYGLLDMTWVKLPMWFVLLGYYILISRRFNKNLPGTDHCLAPVQDDNEKFIPVYTSKQETLATIIFFGNMALMIIASFTQIVPAYLICVAFACLSVGLNLISDKDAFKSVSWTVIFMVAGSLPLATAMNVSGAGKWIAALVQETFPILTTPVLLASAFCAITMLCTQFMHNTAVWSVFSPIAAVMAIDMGMDPRLVVAGVACGAIISFGTPMAQVASAYTYGICNFNMKEFIKLGWVPCVLMTIAFFIWAPIVFKLMY